MLGPTVCNASGCSQPEGCSQSDTLCGHDARTTRAEALVETSNPAHMSLGEGRAHASRTWDCSPAGPKPAGVARPAVASLDRTRRSELLPTMPRSQRLVLPRRSVKIRSHVTPESPAEAGSPGRRAKAQQAAHPHTPDIGSRCPSAAEATSGHESHLVPPRGRSELSCALSSRSRGEPTPAPDTSPRVTTQQTPAT
jgi:hypothetical protein